MFSNRFFAFILLALTIQPATAQVPMTGAGLGAPGVVVAYQGPGDIASDAIAFYSAGRSYNAAYATAASPLADLVDTATGLLTCTMKVKATGFADLTSAVCPTSSPTTNVVTWCTVTVGGCSVTKLYDQTGNGNHVVQATLANMPPFTFSAQNGLPCPAGKIATTYLETAGSITAAQPWSMTGVTEVTGNVATIQYFASTNGTGTVFRHRQANQTQFANSGPALTVTDSAFHAYVGVMNTGVDPLFAADSSGNTTTTDGGAGTLGGNFYVMGHNGTTQGLLTGFVCEIGIWPSDQNANYQALLANMRSATNGWNF